MIAVDIDGVIADTDVFFIRAFEAHTGNQFDYSKQRTYNYLDGFEGLTEETALEIIRDVIITHWGSIPVLNPFSTYCALNNIMMIDGCVEFLTARDKRTEHNTYRWINYHFGKGLHYGVNFSDNKAQWLKDRPWFKYIVEDNLEIANECALNSNITVFLINQPWNIDRYTDPRIVRVDKLMQAVELVGVV